MRYKSSCNLSFFAIQIHFTTTSLLVQKVTLVLQFSSAADSAGQNCSKSAADDG